MKVSLISKVSKERVNWSDQQFISWAKEKLTPLVPEEEEFIPREYWCPFEELSGVNLNNQSHPIWQLSHRIIKDNYIKNSDTIVIQSCANKKPYIDARHYKYPLKLYREGYFDLFVCSWELVPIDFSPFYPYRWYDWNHQDETPFMTDCCISHCFRNICDFIEYFGYKKVIFFTPITEEEGFYDKLFKRVKNFFRNSEVEVLTVTDESSFQKVKDYYGISHPGIIKSRWYNFNPIKEKLASLVGYDENKKVDPKDYIYGHKNKELIKYLERDKTSTYIPPTKEDKVTEEVKEIVKEEVPKIKPKVKEIESKITKPKKSTNKYSFSLVDYLYENLPNILEKNKGYKRRDLIKLVKSKLPADEYSEVYLTKNIDSMTINYPKKKELVRKDKLIIKDDLIYLLEENNE